VSDRYLTQQCGFLQLLAPGDLVLADRGFNIDDDLRFYGCTDLTIRPRATTMDTLKALYCTSKGSHRTEVYHSHIGMPSCSDAGV